MTLAKTFNSELPAGFNIAAIIIATTVALVAVTYPMFVNMTAGIAKPASHTVSKSWVEKNFFMSRYQVATTDGKVFTISAEDYGLLKKGDEICASELGGLQAKSQCNHLKP